MATCTVPIYIYGYLYHSNLYMATCTIPIYIYGYLYYSNIYIWLLVPFQYIYMATCTTPIYIWLSEVVSFSYGVALLK